MTGRILIADDEQSVRESLGKALQVEGYDVVLTDNGQDAIQRMIQEHVDLLLLDLGMPSGDGWSLLKWLSTFNPLLPVIIITGRWRQAERSEAAGADILMEKPLDVPRLLQHIHDLLQEPADDRIRRIQDRKRQFKSVGCDSRRFRQGLELRYTAPFDFHK